MTTLDVAKARKAFPALSSTFIYADNAGGSQCLADAAARISDYLLHTNVQLGADYAVSVASTGRVAAGAEAARELFNAESVDEVAFGSSATMLVENLARAMEIDVHAGDELIITGEHEANGGPWKRLAARRGATIKTWNASHISAYPNNPYAVSLQLDDLLPLISTKTRLVAFTGCSNILGSIVPVKEVVQAVRRRAKELGAGKVEVCVDCVAYAPHRRMDVRDWDVDYCVFSMYKASYSIWLRRPTEVQLMQVYGPHASVLYTRTTSLRQSLSSLAHHFLAPQVVLKPYKLQPGGPGYEVVYGCTAVPVYLRSLTPSSSLEDAFDAIAKHEQTLIAPLLAYLRSKESRGVRIVGDEGESLNRVPTISFVVIGKRAMRSSDVVRGFDEREEIGIRYGHFYAYTLVDTLEPRLETEDGVVRISLVHYNTVDEVDRIIETLEETLA
ncbi:PLP-dependent transferase [Laetiporus sulphureus 93-53]|uniref:PLP-dependent transferase n=1 Tax=Laetiporus sulphureus 93-53 TaxID=1314785 RepID=A0A165DG32_9APHY|nr:PLP-dependent transferase [Laetiporus sulphureus 93-53]KZT04816.1 PLP-dependent transferase [Laetiporus sulphureus 93-53]